MRRAYAPALASLLLGCALNASTQPPEDATAAPAAAEAEAPASSSPAGEPAAEGAAAGDAAPEPAAAGIGSRTLTASGDTGGLAAAGGGETPADPDDGSPAPDAGEPAAGDEPGDAPVATLELPKPLHTKRDEACGNDPGVGERLKAFSLPGIEGEGPVTQGTFKGRVLVVNFWGTWCKPCLKELPEFDQLYRRYRKHGMTLLAIATDDDAKAVKDLVTEKRWGAKIAIAGEAYAGQYGSPKFPFTFVVDHKGVIQASYRGYKPECLGQLEADIREQLEARADAKAKRKKG
jgi:thiol-disulfide isomerase/thioredoxin